MTQQASLAALHERIASVNDVLNATSLLTWDSRTMMPAGGAETRGQQIATLTRLARDLLLASETEQALDEAERADALRHRASPPRAGIAHPGAGSASHGCAGRLDRGTIEERLFHLRPVPGKDRQPLTRLCRLHRLERASL